MSNVQCPMSNVQCPMSKVQGLMSNVQCPMSSVQCPKSNVHVHMITIQNHLRRARFWLTACCSQSKLPISPPCSSLATPWLCCCGWVGYLGAKLGCDEDEELFGRVPVGFGPEGPAILNHHFSAPASTLENWTSSSWITACSQALCNWLRFGLAETGVAFNDIRLKD